MAKRFLITGGAGFIGSAVVRHLIRETDHSVLVVDKLTYAGNLASLASVSRDPRYQFVRADIADKSAMKDAIGSFRPDVIMNLAAETHVDRSIDGPAAFVETNVVGTFLLLQCALAYWSGLKGQAAENFRFHHVSTDEVFGSLGPEGLFREETAYDPNSPYAASKAASDHFVRAWCRTYGLPTLVSNCSNNYGPFHFPEKLIPLTILNGLEGRPIPVYGRGENIRDWLYVDDHARALILIAERGAVDSTYNIGANNESSNLALVESICKLLDALAPNPAVGARKGLIKFVDDRPGHDRRYAIDASKLRRELGWRPQENLDTGLRKTVQWYLDNQAWWKPIRDHVYGGERLGIGV